MHHPGVLPLLRRKADARKAKDGRVLVQEAKSSEDPAVLGEVLVRDSEAPVRSFRRTSFPKDFQGLGGVKLDLLSRR